jgi:hypothetical protein
MWPPPNNQYASWIPGPANWLDICLGTVGWGYGDVPPGRRQAYCDLIAPNDSPSAQKAYGKLSGCALSALGWMRCWGLSDPELWAPYRPGRAVSDVARIALRHDAWSKPDSMPGLGDIVLVGGHSQWGGTEHVFAVVDLEGPTVRSVDGGQADSQGQAILLRERQISRRGTQIWIGSRRVMGVARVGLMVPSREQFRPVTL